MPLIDPYPTCLSSSSSAIVMLVELSLIWKQLNLTLTVPSSQLHFLQSQKDAFCQSLSTYENEGNLGSPLELCLKFVEFLIEQHSPRSALAAVLRAFESRFLQGDEEIHSKVVQSIPDPKGRQDYLTIYYRGLELGGHGDSESHGLPARNRMGALLQHAQQNRFQLLAVFGGQGEASRTCVQELINLYATYESMLHSFFGTVSDLLNKLSSLPECVPYFGAQPLDLRSWVNNDSVIPDSLYIAQAPISVPVIGVLSLARYCVTCRLLDLSPGELRTLFRATTGHSQGLLVSAVIAMSDSWDSFYENSGLAVEALFWLGWECHRGAPRTPASAANSASGYADECNMPSYMLSVRGVKRGRLESIIAQMNRVLPVGGEVHLALINALDQFVVAGPSTSLVHLHSYLTEVVGSNKDQSRVPFSSRKPWIHSSFLPISTSFHTPVLTEAADALKNRFFKHKIVAEDLKIPVYHTHTGQDLRESRGNILHTIFDAIARELCDWPSALTGSSHLRNSMHTPSHIIVFDRGGLGLLVKKVQEGRGIRVIQASDLESRDPEIGTMRDLFSPRLLETSTRVQSWSQRYQPRLVNGGTVTLETRLSRLLGSPPIMVAGMTPTTVHWDFVAAIMNAGYHVELAGGGYRNSSDMSAAINNLVDNVRPGRGVTCNLIYASPRAMGWQVPMLRRLSHERVPIDGLTIGAGVPSGEVVSEYIRTLGLRHISFKPSSVSTIRQVVDIAKTHPDFPIILQWTGGRGGGHHSYEDFHAPILSTYSSIRQQPNIYLVAGSGFGDSESIYPYLTGQWSVSHGYPCMPFDGVLLGSRLMVAREAHTSPAVKRVITNTPGVPDDQWTNTYSRPAGGILTVRSEMGEPIHKVATRGVQLWADMDQTVFKLPKKERVAYLTKNRKHIIRRLNAEFAKPWFGRNSHGVVVDLEDMTYAEVLHRMVDLMYVRHQKRWIDPSYVSFVLRIASRTLERLPCAQIDCHADLTHAVLSENPDLFLCSICEVCPATKDEILNPEDVSFFLLESKKPNQKPVNFIPAFNEDFELYFKKDSLWQAEDIEAVPDQDPERVCILHGPVAAQYSVDRDESAQEILNNIMGGIIERVQRDTCSEDSTSSSTSGLATPDSWSSISGMREIAVDDISTPMSSSTSDALDDRSVHVSAAAISLSRSLPPWIRAVLGEPVLLQNQRRQRNPFQQFIAANPAAIFHYDADRGDISVCVQDTGRITSSMKLSSPNGVNIVLELYPPQILEPLRLFYRFDPSSIPFSLSEIMDHRNARVKSFYSRLWFGEDVSTGGSIHDTFYGKEMTLTEQVLQDLIAGVGPAFPDPRLFFPDSDVLPISVGIVIAWDVLTKPSVLRVLGGDLLRLVHRSNSFEYCSGAAMLRIGDTVSSQSQVRAVYVEEAGMVVVVEAQIMRSGKAVLTVTSTFLFRGTFAEDGDFFRRIKEPQRQLQIKSELDETVLRRREWFCMEDDTVSLVGKTLLFKLETHTIYKEGGIKSLHVTGTAHTQPGGYAWKEVGKVNYSCDSCFGNPVLDFLDRRGTLATPEVKLKTPGWSGLSSLEVQMPPSNQPYANVSKDFNPIHVSSIFASLADLPGTLSHGMLTSAVTVAAFEHLALHGDRTRLRSFTSSFTGMVMPLEKLVVQIQHTAMVEGRMRFAVEVTRKDGGERVLEGHATVDQPATAYLFTGQGSQSKGMGMDLYESSPVAKALWDETDAQLYNCYGWSVLDIVRNNPKSITVHFGGKRGRKIRQNYLAITTETVLPDNTRIETPALPGLTPRSTSYTFTDSRGLLYSTQFAQPAILLFEVAVIADLRSNGYVSPDALYAGHSLGEYGALSALSQSIPLAALAELSFYRGVMMQASVAREQGAAYGMMAINPKRVGVFFDPPVLGRLVEAIAMTSCELLEIVNYNVKGEQYVCSGTDTNLWVLGKVLDGLSQSPDGPDQIKEMMNDEKGTRVVDATIKGLLAAAHGLPRPIQLQRGTASIPLQGIDVPFHSSHLKSTVDRFRQCLLRPGFLQGNVNMADLEGRYIPNVMAKPFAANEDYVREVYAVTQSPILGEILGVTA
ncbi:sterigmatocystin biosynthesis fatty acid synthase subunit beta [Aspergillus homomorphus CBS 101889]|uniref:Sterigmatocystin biosynthesis fatty acid synthase subunit beta n=1 Tax=Aspergillus homomorphus (strain CBS 101889) TaxID=1450537 RepID=A0A395HWS1_ASPHC|nr:sterigmatocystin biosynthesis fatty acid synthase subunit beta [Aspergillus homomorphus CBS 101889]RAL11875.1 sterigmatocystin biosynthesis fatty acid synthase subunit beta [Aspergillus homomorphus CBS 101889]